MTNSHEMESRTSNISRKRIILSQVVACLALDFLLIGLGMSVSFVTVVLPKVLNAKEGLSMNKEQASWFGSVAFLCQPLGSIFSGPILDYFGRKKALFLVNIPHVIAWLMLYLAWDLPSLYLGNALLGIGTGFMEAPSVSYVAEVSDPLIRGTLTTSTTAFTSFGVFMAYLLGSTLPWRQAALVSLIVPLTTMALVFIIPETPIWLISKGQHKNALRSLCRLRGWARPEDVKEEFDQLVHYSEIIHQCSLCLKGGEGGKNENTCPHANDNFIRKNILKFRYVFLQKETVQPFILVMAYFLFHSMGGFIPLRPNMVNICKALGMKYDSEMIIILVGVITILMNVLSAITVKMMGKRKLILTSLLAMACSCVAISVYAGVNLSPNVFSYDVDTFPNKKDTLPVLLFMLLVCFHGLGIPWVLLSEVFPFRSRGMATGLAAAFSYVIFFLASKTNYNLEANFHLTGTFIIYAGFGIVGTAYLYFFLPETENKSLIEIEAYYKDGQRIFADDFLINAFKKKLRTKNRNSANTPMLNT